MKRVVEEKPALQKPKGKEERRVNRKARVAAKSVPPPFPYLYLCGQSLPKRSPRLLLTRFDPKLHLSVAVVESFGFFLSESPKGEILSPGDRLTRNG